MSYISTNFTDLQDLIREINPEELRLAELGALGFLADLRKSGQLLSTSQPRRPRQSPAEVASIVEHGEAALAALTALELEAGPSAKAKLGAAKRFQGEFARAGERKRERLRLLGQRNALARVLSVQMGVNVITRTDAQVEAFVNIILDLSANVAALTGSGWSAVATWIERNFPTLFDDVGITRLKLDFDKKLNRSAKALAAGSDLRTAPGVTHIAHELGITRAHLRTAGANRVGLTSIDRVDPKSRWRERSDAHRRAKGCKVQSEMNTREEDQRLAALAGCTDRTIRAHRLKGDLADWLASKGVDFPKSSPVKKIYDETSLGSSNILEQTIDLNGVFVFYDGERNLNDAAGPFPELRVSRPSEEEARHSQPPVRSDG